MNIDLKDKQWLTLGNRNTGKTYFNRWLLKQASGNYAVFDPMREYDDRREDDLVILPENTRGDEAIEELNEFVDLVVENRETFDYLVIDEVNRFHGKHGELTGSIGELVDLSAHYDNGLGVGYVARRPTQVHADLRGLVDYLFVFSLKGVNDIRLLDEISSGLGERVSQLDPREFMVVEPDRTYSKHEGVRDTSIEHTKGI